MIKNLSYLWMSVVIMLVQIFLLDELSIAMWLRPMIFPLVVILIKMEWRTIWVLLVSTLLGIIMDVALGGSGLYTSTLVPLAIMRRWILYLTTGRSIESGDQTSVLSRLSRYQMMGYVAAMLAIHHTLFFSMEALSTAQLFTLIATILFSTLLSCVVAWPIIRIFTLKIVAK